MGWQFVYWVGDIDGTPPVPTEREYELSDIALIELIRSLSKIGRKFVIRKLAGMARPGTTTLTLGQS